MTLPNFMIIGGAKAATSSLAVYLAQHPDVFMSPQKEPHYFSRMEIHNSLAGPGDRAREGMRYDTLELYSRLFQGAENSKAVGEASTTYLSTPGTAARIKKHLPQVKLIAVLRNPVDRAFSCYMHLVRDGDERLRTFEEALEAEPERMRMEWASFWYYKKLGFYKAQLDEYYGCFPEENIKIFLYDDLKADINGALREIFAFIGVSPEVAINTERSFNVGGLPQNLWYHHLVAERNFLKTAVKHFLPRKWRVELKEKMTAKNLHRPDMKPETRQMLLSAYRDDILALQDLIKRDLSGWLK